MKQLAKNQVLRQPVPHTAGPRSVTIRLARRSDVGIRRRLHRALRFGIILPGWLLFDHHAGVVFGIAPIQGIQRFPSIFTRSFSMGERCIRKTRTHDADFFPRVSSVVDTQQQLVPGYVELARQCISRSQVRTSLTGRSIEFVRLAQKSTDVRIGETFGFSG
jgi:hypothetical protein